MNASKPLAEPATRSTSASAWKSRPPGVAVPEGLLLGPGRGGEWGGAVRQIEDVSVPMQDSRFRSQRADDRVGGIVDLHRGEPDLGRSPALTSAPSARASSPSQTSRMWCGVSQGTCWMTSRVGRPALIGAG